MNWKVLRDRQKIAEILDFLVSRKVQLKVSIEGEKGEFSSKMVKVERGGITTNIGKRPEIIIEKLTPPRGNTLLQSTNELTIEFLIQKNQCRCGVKYLGISSEYPYFGFILTYPELMEVQEKRVEERNVLIPEFVSVIIRLRKDPEKEYSLNVLDCSMHGLGILITQKDMDLLEKIQPGDQLEDMTFFTEIAFIRVKGTVRHISKIGFGKYQGSYMMGIESPDIIENCKPTPP